ncbi:hypothetical protein EVAR_70554_1 [Eumeta japonica]|uniref:Uncharacterized protein n=1 Tax=Eumeta variegata TaxID=151549 RepID=A0A4C2A795_EUMVA|nr:hypothetical protein EVAR_70554_1 [Eumeta japonica]
MLIQHEKNGQETQGRADSITRECTLSRSLYFRVISLDLGLSTWCWLRTTEEKVEKRWKIYEKEDKDLREDKGERDMG